MRDLTALSERILATPCPRMRRIVAVAGPPAGGKSTLAAHLADALPRACVVPMDGFHLDNRVLDARGLLPRKGAPQTYDVAGFIHLVTRLAHEPEVIYPLFDRASEQAIAGAGVVGPDIDTVVVEGNYLLLDADPWRDLRPHWDFCLFLTVDLATLQDRLMARWRGYGLSDADARAKAHGNDLPNAKTVLTHRLPADLTLDESDVG